MNPFDTPVTRYMSADLEVVTADTPLDDVVHLFDECGISAVPVVDAGGAIAGVVSRSDVVGAPSWTAPAGESIGRRAPVVVPITATLHAAAREMCVHHVHRVFVVDGFRPVGVVSTTDLCRAVRDARVDTPIGEIMTTPIITVRVDQPIRVAVEALERAHITGVIVIDDDWPVGVFSQIEALRARDLPRETPVDDALEPAIICMPTTTRAHRAAAMVARLDVRRVIACAHREAVGVVTGLDFARIVGGVRERDARR